MIHDDAIYARTTIGEADALERLLHDSRLTAASASVLNQAQQLTAAMRSALRHEWFASFTREYGLQNAEGAALLGLAESYLRIPDSTTVDALIADKLLAGDWKSHIGASTSTGTNAATWALIAARAALDQSGPARPWTRLRARVARGIIRRAMGGMMNRLGRQFVFAPDIDAAMQRARRQNSASVRHSFDMLGEAACCVADEERYFDAYLAAIQAVGLRAPATRSLIERDNVSVKLSALSCRYEPPHGQRALPALIARVLELARAAMNAGIGLTIDAEESERLAMSLQVLAALARDPSLRGWDGLGLAVQAYQRRAPAIIAWTDELARSTHRRLIVRLVKGAYWDTEIKSAQTDGLNDYPVFTRKAATDLCYLACARAMLDAGGIYPAFATHNALTVAAVLECAGARRDLEFQRLHGMGAALYRELRRQGVDVACRVYAPVGPYVDLLPYLVRRLLENATNRGFLHQLGDERLGVEQVLGDPVNEIRSVAATPNSAIALPREIYGQRPNSRGFDFADQPAVDALCRHINDWEGSTHRAYPVGAGLVSQATARPVFSPTHADRVVGEVIECDAVQIDPAFTVLVRAQSAWAALPVCHRAACLDRAADLMELQRDEFMALAVQEAGKTLTDALAEVREAVDFCRYYAANARATRQPHAARQSREWKRAARGVFACISPWNFPLSIFMGQVSAALVTGNAVIAKPAPQTPLMAAAAVRVLLAAGVPADVLALVPGGAALGAKIVSHSSVNGVAFTGSNATALQVARALLTPARPPVTMIAETGGVNAMIVDSSALPEQVVHDVIISAFHSAGQRCSALRLLCLQEDVADRVLALLCGAMDTLRIGDPAAADTQVGPVIDRGARERLDVYVQQHRHQLLYRCSTPVDLPSGHFVMPCLLRLQRIEELRQELFGPVLHVVVWKAGQLQSVIHQVNASGYGLTMGLHSRIQGHIDCLHATAAAGNIYVNRSMVGAVVGTQPFGGEGLSGTGPKAGGPHYLQRFQIEGLERRS